MWKSLIFGFGPTIILLLLLFWIFRRMSGSRTAGALGRAKARRYEPGHETVTFADVAGIDEAKQELTEIVDFLRDPDKYRRLGGRIPRGVLLSGPPGTGKTLLARAVAGEAGAPFFSMSASEFVEAIVGVGASRVRDLFRQAKKESPAIVFIDELDAVGRARSTAGGYGGGSDEREQTLNQILTEMDGFDSSTAVIVIGATNRIDVLDQALLRPGRFDRRVAVLPPDREGRRLILEVHTRDVPLAPDVDLDRIAATTPGMVGADLANLVNEAALLAARLGPQRGQLLRLRAVAREDPPRRRAEDHDDAGRSPAHRVPRGRPCARRDAHGRAPIRCARSRSSRAGSRSASRSRRPTSTDSTTRARSSRRESRWRSAAARPRSSSSATRRPAPRATSPRSRRSCGTWSAAGG